MADNADWLLKLNYVDFLRELRLVIFRSTRCLRGIR